MHLTIISDGMSFCFLVLLVFTVETCIFKLIHHVFGKNNCVIHNHPPQTIYRDSIKSGKLIFKVYFSLIEQFPGSKLQLLANR